MLGVRASALGGLRGGQRVEGGDPGGPPHPHSRRGRASEPSLPPPDLESWEKGAEKQKPRASWGAASPWGRGPCQPDCEPGQVEGPGKQWEFPWDMPRGRGPESHARHQPPCWGSAPQQGPRAGAGLARWFSGLGGSPPFRMWSSRPVFGGQCLLRPGEGSVASARMVGGGSEGPRLRSEALGPAPRW